MHEANFISPDYIKFNVSIHKFIEGSKFLLSVSSWSILEIHTGGFLTNVDGGKVIDTGLTVGVPEQLPPPSPVFLFLLLQFSARQYLILSSPAWPAFSRLRSSKWPERTEITFMSEMRNLSSQLSFLFFSVAILWSFMVIFSQRLQ